MGEDGSREGSEGRVLSDSAATTRRLYGRRVGRPLRSGRADLLENLYPQLAIPLPPAGQVLDPRTLFAGPRADVWLEIGFGSGEHLLAQALAHPDIGILGCEPFLNGVSALLKQAAALPALPAVRLLSDDARFLLAALPAGALGRIFVLHPDPWPKKRHHDRRIVSPVMLAEFARVLRPGGELRLATDHPDYAVWMDEQVAATPHFRLERRWTSPDRPDPADWPRTRYEGKARAKGILCHYFTLRKNA